MFQGLSGGSRVHISVIGFEKGNCCRPMKDFVDVIYTVPI